MSITEKENELFIKWSANRPGFIMDGVPDESAYQASEPRIMFVMKEVEELGGGTGDHREFLRRGRCKPSAMESHDAMGYWPQTIG